MEDQTEFEASPAEEGTSEDVQESENTEASDENDGTSEASAGADEESTDGQWYVPGRFKTVEDMRQSYSHLESAYGKSQSELSRLRRDRTTHKEPEQLSLEQFAASLQRDPIKAIQDVVRPEVQKAHNEARRVRFESEYERLKTNKEFLELEPIMANIAENFEEVIENTELKNDPRTLHLLFYAAQGVKAQQRMSEAENRGKAKGKSAALKKTKAQVEGQSASKGHQTRNFDELSLEDMRKELLKKK